MGDWEFLIPQEKECCLSTPYGRWMVYKKMCVLVGKGSFHSATGCTKIVLVSAPLWSMLMELHGGSSIMGYSGYNSVILKS